MAFPNTITDATAIFNGVIRKLLTIGGLTPQNTFVSASPRWLGNSYPGDRYLQVVPGLGKDLSATNGVGRRQHSFVVATYWRLLLDQPGQDSMRLADASAGLLAFIDGVDNAIINSAVFGLANVPIMPDRIEPAESDPQQLSQEWVMVKRVYNVVYLYNFPNAQDLS